MTYGSSRLLDMRDCTSPDWQDINRGIVGLQCLLQPLWFTPFFRLPWVRRRLGYARWPRLWEYPWALLSANLEAGMRVLDVGCGGSSFPAYLAMQGQEVHAADPTLIDAAAYGGWKKRALQFLGITSLWGLPPPPKAAGIPVRYVPDSMQNLRYDDGFFDRVFCLSVMEHIPDREWPECMRELSRVLSEGGRLALTLSMSDANANVRQYEKLLVEPSLRLVGNVDYVVPIGAGDKRARHPGHTLEILGLIWDKK